MVAPTSKKKQSKSKSKSKPARLIQGVLIVLLGLVMLIVLGGSKDEIENATTTTTTTNGAGSNTLISMGHWDWHPMVRTQSGPGWQLWNATAPMILVDDHTKWAKCRWTTFKATNGQTAQMCVHYGDAVSRAIINRGRWADCDILTQQFEETHPNKQHKIYMDVGANIGACVLQMLFTTESPVIAFEPEPMNLFCLTNTIMRLEPRYRDRFLLFPFAVSDAPGTTQIQAQVGDMGNAFLGDVKAGDKDKRKDNNEEEEEEEEEKFKRSVQVPVEALDNVIIATAGEDIALMKLHAQGHECQVLNGMPNLVTHIHAIHTEIYKTSLELQGCSSDAYMKQLEQAGFEIQHKQKFLLDEEQQGKSEVLALNKNMK
ncbi:unnamed protein product [Cylindrotheca closterium]|uniref:Methyltransferase FkbM domain-containing protein n=1 Tax=Cylindrotheca closterium TaxID=2856 RepID=A0AAD2G8C5_9STRA|nr:unnamed protein product [Cylindrotheca closterium]